MPADLPAEAYRGTLARVGGVLRIKAIFFFMDPLVDCKSLHNSSDPHTNPKSQPWAMYVFSTKGRQEMQ